MIAFEGDREKNLKSKKYMVCLENLKGSLWNRSMGVS